MEVARRLCASLKRESPSLLLALLFASCFRIGVAQAYVVEGHSMLPTLDDGERLVVSRWAYGLAVPGVEHALATWALPYPGDIVVVRSPDEDVDLVKRVIGLPGDVIEIRDGDIVRNGHKVTRAETVSCDDPALPRCRRYIESSGRSSYWTQWSQRRRYDQRAPMRIPADSIYVLGDHRDASNDSRAFGPVPASLLRGRVLFEGP